MFVEEIVEFDGAGASKLVTGWHEVENAIRIIDGKSKTGLLLRRDTNAEMIITGGRNGYFHVYISKRGEKPLSLVSPEADVEEEMEMIICGQGTDFRMWQLVHLPEAIAAARTFCESGEAEPSLTWFAGGTRDWEKRQGT